MKEDIAMGNWIRSHMLLFFLGIFALLTCYPILFLFGASLMGNPEIGQVLGGDSRGAHRLCPSGSDSFISDFAVIC